MDVVVNKETKIVIASLWQQGGVGANSPRFIMILVFIYECSHLPPTPTCNQLKGINKY